MIRKSSVLLVLVFFVFSTTLLTTPTNAKSKNVWKSTSIQIIPRGKWTTLEFDKNNNKMNPYGSRSIYCTQVHLTFGKSKPKYVKLRLARVLPSGKLDTTGTNTWVLGKNSPNKWQGANCWIINPKHPVVAQVKYVGGSKSVKSSLRQFKSWNPNSPLDDSLLTFPE